MKACILAFDIGTSAVKASLVSSELKVLAEASSAYQTYFPPPRLCGAECRGLVGRRSFCRTYAL